MSSKWPSIVPLLKTVVSLAVSASLLTSGSYATDKDKDDSNFKTPIKHIVVIFQENVSFDHYFATYPRTTNPGHEPLFKAKDGTPSVNGLTRL